MISSSLITIKQLSEKLQISRATIDRWRKEGMPSHRVGRGVRFEEAQVMSWISSNKGKQHIENT